MIRPRRAAGPGVSKGDHCRRPPRIGGTAQKVDGRGRSGALGQTEQQSEDGGQGRQRAQCEKSRHESFGSHHFSPLEMQVTRGSRGGRSEGSIGRPLPCPSGTRGPGLRRRAKAYPI